MAGNNYSQLLKSKDIENFRIYFTRQGSNIYLVEVVNRKNGHRFGPSSVSKFLEGRKDKEAVVKEIYLKKNGIVISDQSPNISLSFADYEKSILLEKDSSSDSENQTRFLKLWMDEHQSSCAQKGTDRLFLLSILILFIIIFASVVFQNHSLTEKVNYLTQETSYLRDNNEELTNMVESFEILPEKISHLNDSFTRDFYSHLEESKDYFSKQEGRIETLEKISQRLQKVFRGETKTDAWQNFGDTGVFVSVDISDLNLTKNPHINCVLLGGGTRHDLGGINININSPTNFDVYFAKPGMVVSAEYAINNGWYLSYQVFPQE